MTGEGLKNIGEGLKPIKSLNAVSLTFSSNEKITDEGLKGLGEGLKSLDFLHAIKLNFSW